MNYELICQSAKQLLGNNPAVWELRENAVIIDGIAYPLTPWHYNRRLHTMRPMIQQTKVLREVCNYKSQRIECNDKDLYELLYEELDTAEWLLGEHIVSVYATINEDKTLTAILKTDCKTLCNLTISATLPQGTAPITRHELVGLEGMICDRSINEQIPVESVYVFGEGKPQTFTDFDFNMLGLSPQEIMLADNVMQLILNRPNVDDLLKTDKRNQYLVECAIRSSKTGEVVEVEEYAI